MFTEKKITSTHVVQVIIWLLPSQNPYFHRCFNRGQTERCQGKIRKKNQQHPLSGTLTFQKAVLVSWQQFIKLQCLLGGTNNISALTVWTETTRGVVGKAPLFPKPGTCYNSSLLNLVYNSPVQSALKHCHTIHQAFTFCKKKKKVYSHLTWLHPAPLVLWGQKITLEIDV